MIDTIKPAEDGEGWIVRLYESSGGSAAARLTFGTKVRQIVRSNTLEDRGEALAVKGGVCALPVRPFQIVTLRIS